MFCHKCGNQVADGAAFCHKCGTKVIYKKPIQHSVDTFSATIDAGNDGPELSQDETKSFTEPVELIVSIAKVEGRAYLKVSFAVFIDDNSVGELANGETSILKITPGQHCVKIGVARIWITAPDSSTPVNLNFKWGPDVQHEIVCQQAHLVTKPSVREKVTIQTVFKSLPIGIVAGLVCTILGAIGFIVGLLLSPSSSGGGIVTAEQHGAMLAALDFALPFVIGGFVFVIIGAITLILSSRKK